MPFDPSAYSLFEETRPQTQGYSLMDPQMQDAVNNEDPRSAFAGYGNEISTPADMLEASMLGSGKNQDFQKRAFAANKIVGNKVGDFFKGKKNEPKKVPGIKSRTPNPVDPDMTYLLLRSILENMGIGV